MTPTCKAIRRARRTMLTMLHAADLLERDAEALKFSHTIGGRWSRSRIDRGARRDYDDMIATARALRRFAGVTAPRLRPTEHFSGHEPTGV